jgi:hypothetical protein
MRVERKIFFSKECDSAALAVGGYEKIDKTLDAIWDALLRNPYGFTQIECDWFSAGLSILSRLPTFRHLCGFLLFLQGEM